MINSGNIAPKVDLFALVDSVNDEQTFIAFLRALGEDFANEQRAIKAAEEIDKTLDESGMWESTSIDGMLEAATAWADDVQQRGDIAEQDVWRRCATIVFAGKHYE